VNRKFNVGLFSRLFFQIRLSICNEIVTIVSRLYNVKLWAYGVLPRDARGANALLPFVRPSVCQSVRPCVSNDDVS